MAERPTTLLEYGAFLQAASPLFGDYVAGRSGAERFYAGGAWDLAAIEAAGRRSLSYTRSRAEMAAVLEDQQLARGASQAAVSARRLEQAEALAIVTGQQAGLFGGPLYVLYKALTAVKVATLLEQERRKPVVPVFWVASDDHDFAEVRATTAIDESGQLRTLRYEPHQEPGGQPAARIRLDDGIVKLEAELEAALPAGLGRDAMLALLRDCYRPEATLAGAFASLLSKLLPELVVLDPADPRIKALLAPVMERELLEHSPTSRLAGQVGVELLAAGYHQQVPVRAGFLNLFTLEDGQRRALAWRNGDVEVRGPGRRLPLADAVRLLREDPASWSPGVLLRPLAQDHLLPTAAYVGGPAEIAYHAQIGPSYAHFGIPRPVLVPRPSLTLVEPGQARALETEGLTLPDLQTDPENLLARWAREAYPEVESAFGRATQSLEREMEAVQEVLARLDPTLAAAADAARGRALHQIQTLHEKATRALKKRDQTRAERLRRTRDALLPGGAPQERGLGLIGPLARHGEGVIAQIRERMDPWARGHQVIYL